LIIGDLGFFRGSLKSHRLISNRYEIPIKTVYFLAGFQAQDEPGARCSIRTEHAKVHGKR
jgi:hypothetical protein